MVEPLPNELVETILDNLYFDTAVLLNCALVGRAWVQASQRGIFRHITLELPSQRHKDYNALVELYLKLTGRIVESLNAKPVLASYVKSLQLRRFSERNQPGVLLTAAASVVQQLSELSDLSFFYIHWRLGLSPLLRTLITGLLGKLTSVSFLEFYIDTFAELASLLSNAVHLRVLDARFYIRDRSVPTVSSLNGTPSQTIQLTELKMDIHIEPFVVWFQKDSCPFGVRNLQSLCVNIGMLEQTEFIRFLQYEAGKNLKALELRGLDLDDLNNYLEFTPNLQVLHLGMFRINHADSVAMIQALFRPLNGQHIPLQHLGIEIDLTRDYSGLYHFNWEPWAAIDALLQRPRFPLLETVHFKLALSMVSHKGNNVVDLLRRNLPFLEGSGKLVVQIMTNSI